MNHVSNLIKILLACSAILIALSFAFGQYTRTREHNIDVITSKRLCYEAKDIGSAAESDCVQKSEAQYINISPEGLLGFGVGVIAIFLIARWVKKS